MGKAKVWNFSTSLQLLSERSERSDFPHPASHVETWNSKMVNLGKEIENDKNLNEMKLGPSMNIFRNFDPYTTLDPFYPSNDFKSDQILKK